MKYLFLSIVATLGLVSFTANADNFPSRSIKIIVPFPPGGSTDIATRLVADGLQRELGQSVVVENKPGAGGLIGVGMLENAAPDGYTIGLGNEATHVTAPLMKAKMPFDPLKAFTPLTIAINTTMAIAINPAVAPVNTLAELIEYSKKKGGGISYGTPGIGTPQHLIGELLKQRSGGNFVHVPYRGSGLATNDLVSGQIAMTISTLPSLLPYLGKVKVLAIGDLERLKSMPTIPTVSETLPDFEVGGWSGYFGPANLAPPVADRLSRAMIKVLHSPKVADAMRQQELEPAGTSPEELTERIETGLKRWSGVIERAGLEKQN